MKPKTRSHTCTYRNLPHIQCNLVSRLCAVWWKDAQSCSIWNVPHFIPCAFFPKVAKEREKIISRVLTKRWRTVAWVRKWIGPTCRFEWLKQKWIIVWRIIRRCSLDGDFQESDRNLNSFDLHKARINGIFFIFCYISIDNIFAFHIIADASLIIQWCNIQNKLKSLII